MEKIFPNLNLGLKQMQTIGAVLADLLRSNEPLAIAYRKRMAAKHNADKGEYRHE